MTESLLSGSNIVLFGRVVEDLLVATPASPPPETPKGVVSDLQEAINNKGGGKSATARFARIYGFSYAGTYFEILRPAMFLVHGPGVPAPKVIQPGPDTEDTPFMTTCHRGLTINPSRRSG